MAASLEPGSSFAGYRIETVVGRGGMGVVYRATELALERTVALKLVAPELAGDDTFRERFLRESRLAAAIEHPHILPVYAAGEADGALYLVTRFVEGEDLKARLEREGRLEPEAAVALVEQIASALDAAHARGLVHRDVKPGNVLIASSGESYLCDFGLTKPAAGEHSLTASGLFVGTLDYAAPEQIADGAVDGRADQYALACVLYECLTGAKPFERSSAMAVMWAHMNEEPDALRKRRPELPAAIDEVVAKALAKEPGGRFAACSAFAAAAAEALGLGAVVRRAPLAPPWFRRRARLVAAVGGLLVAGSVAAAVVQLTGGGDGGISLVAGNAVALVDPDTNRVVAQIPVGRSPTSVAVGEGAVWVLNADDRTITRIDPETREAGAPFAIGGTPIDLAVGEGAVWVATGTPAENTQFGGPVLDAVAQLDPDTSSVRAVVEIPHEGPTVFSSPRQRLAVAAGSLWVALPSGSVARVDAASGQTVATVDGIGAYAVASDGQAVWILDSDGTVKRISPRTNGVTARFVLQTSGLDSIAVGGGDVWVSSSADGVVWRITVAPEPVSRTIELESGVGALAYRDGALWAANGLRGTVSRIDPATNQVVATIAVGNTPYAVGADAEGLWVVVQGGPGAVAAQTSVEGLEALPSSFCGAPVYGGEGPPDVLVVSDLPLQGGTRFASVQMEQAIEYVLRQRGFTAGPYGVAYQSCDDSLASTGIFDLDKCAANARAYAANEQVIGVIGTLNSGCAFAEIPVLNEAEGGPVAMISPANSIPSLTRQSLDAPPNILQELYPTGTRNYVRVYATDDMQAAGLVTLARDELGARTIAVVHDGEDGYGEIVATYARTAAERAGLELVATARWDPQAGAYDDLAADIAEARPDAVFVSGLLDSNGAAVVAALRGALGADVPILVPDGFTPLSLFVEQAGDAALGVYVATVGLPDLELAALGNALPPAGVRFVEEFGATQPGGVDLFALYAAQAAEVLLDAIARSDGSRGSVIRELFATRVEDGILGSFTFDSNGDTSLNPVSIYRVAEGGGGTDIASVEGGVLHRVIVPDPALVR